MIVYFINPDSISYIPGEVMKKGKIGIEKGNRKS